MGHAKNPHSDSHQDRYDSTHLIDQIFRAKKKLGLTAGDVETLLALIRHDCPDPRSGGKRKGEVWPGPANGLCDLTGLDERNQRFRLKSLEAKGAITCLTPDRDTGGRGHSHHWRINYEALGWKDDGRGPDKPERIAQVSTDKPERIAQVSTDKPERIAQVSTDKPERIAQVRTEESERQESPPQNVRASTVGEEPSEGWEGGGEDSDSEPEPDLSTEVSTAWQEVGNRPLSQVQKLLSGLESRYGAAVMVEAIQQSAVTSKTGNGKANFGHVKKLAASLSHQELEEEEPAATETERQTEWFCPQCGKLTCTYHPDCAEYQRRKREEGWRKEDFPVPLPAVWGGDEGA
jgi:hypothetical protein